MRSASSITVRMPRSSMSRMVKTSIPVRRMFSFSAMSTSRTADQHAVFRPHLRRPVVQLGQRVQSAQSHQRSQRHAVDIARGRGLRRVDVRVRVNPDQPDVLPLAPVVLGHPAHRAGGNRVISADRQRSLLLLQRVQNLLGQLGAGGRDLAQVAGVRIAKVLLLGQGDADVARILHHVAQRLQLGLQSGHAHAPRAPCPLRAAAAPRSSGTPITQMLLLDYVGKRCGNADHTGVQFLQPRDRGPVPSAFATQRPTAAPAFEYRGARCVPARTQVRRSTDTSGSTCAGMEWSPARDPACRSTPPPAPAPCQSPRAAPRRTCADPDTTGTPLPAARAP